MSVTRHYEKWASFFRNDPERKRSTWDPATIPFIEAIAAKYVPVVIALNRLAERAGDKSEPFRMMVAVDEDRHGNSEVFIGRFTAEDARKYICDMIMGGQPEIRGLFWNDACNFLVDLNQDVVQRLYKRFAPLDNRITLPEFHKLIQEAEKGCIPYRPAPTTGIGSAPKAALES